MQKLQEADMKDEIHEDHLKLDVILKEVQALREEIKELKDKK
jgi:voltage-gated sodium channel